MQQFLSGISVTCFVGSYLVALALELTRPLFRVPARGFVTVAFIVAGLLSQLLYLVMLADPTAGAADVGLLAGWYSWSLLLAWALAACYLVLYLRRPDTTIGYFLLPPVLGLVLLAMAVQDWEPFTRERAAGFWRTIHGLAMLIGATAVLLGFVAGAMFLVQSVRLKQKRPGSHGLRLPTLEWLQKLNRGCLVFSTVAVAVGTLAGVIMNLNESGAVAWSSRGVVLSLVLLVWLLVAIGMEFFYKPARQGRKVAYLTLASFGFLVLAMIGVLASNHGAGKQEEASLAPSPSKGIAASARPESSEVFAILFGGEGWGEGAEALDIRRPVRSKTQPICLSNGWYRPVAWAACTALESPLTLTLSPKSLAKKWTNLWSWSRERFGGEGTGDTRRPRIFTSRERLFTAGEAGR